MKVYELTPIGQTIDGCGTYLGDVWFDEIADACGHRAWHAEDRGNTVRAFWSKRYAVKWLRDRVTQRNR
jgi:hypothetical protein